MRHLITFVISLFDYKHTHKQAYIHLLQITGGEHD